eukprot:2490413-Rhodomonas_salina.2
MALAVTSAQGVQTTSTSATSGLPSALNSALGAETPTTSGGLRPPPINTELLSGGSDPPHPHQTCELRVKDGAHTERGRGVKGRG